MPLRPETQAFVDEHFILTAPGHAFYLQRDVDAWVRNIDRHLGDGYLLTVDYGARRPHLLHQISTGLRPRQLRGYGGRNSLANILGLPVPEALQYEYMHDPTALFLPKDLTIDVDFSTIDEAVHATKRMAQLVLKTQEDFFRSLLESEGGHEGLEDLDRFRRYGDHLVALHGRLTLRRQGATSNGHGV